MVGRSILGGLASVSLALLLGACSSGASPSPSGSQAASLPSQAAPSVAAPSEAAASEAAPSVAAGSSGEPSLAIPSFSLPSDDKGLEALLPDKVCGETSIKASMSGARFAQSGQTEFLDALKAVGKTANDVSFAVAAGANTGCTAGILRINGVDPNTLKTAMLAAASKSGETATEKTVGGKDVYVSTGPDATTYVYFHGDAVLFVSAKNDNDAASVLQTLP